MEMVDWSENDYQKNEIENDLTVDKAKYQFSLTDLLKYNQVKIRLKHLGW